MTQPIPPISTQLSALATAQPDAAAVTCQGRTVSRAELDASTNRLAREYAARGVGVGDYVSIALPNSIEMIESLMACSKVGATPQPLSARLPDAEFAAILDLTPRALIVGRADPRGQTPSLPAGVTVDGSRSSAALPEAVSPIWKSMTSGGSTGRPKLIDAGTDSRLSPLSGYALGAQEGDVQLVSLPLTHNTAVNNLIAGLLLGHHAVVMPRFDPHEFLRLITEHRVTFLATVPTVMQRVYPCTGPTPTPTTCRPFAVSGTWEGRAPRQSSKPGSISWAPTKSGNSTPAPNSKPRRCCPASIGCRIPVQSAWSCWGR